MTSLSDVRASFLDFFRDRQHSVVPSSPLVPRNDPTLLFTNAGMVQFKNVFTGAEKRPLHARDHRAEMRARRRQAQRSRQCRLHRAPPHLLRDAGQFLLRRLFQGRRDRLSPGTSSAKPSRCPRTGCGSRSIPPTTRRGSCGRRSPASPTTASSAMRAISGRWGPRGRAATARKSSTTRGDAVAGGPPGSPDEDGDRFLEFWNLVFMQFEQVDENTRIDLPKPSIDTGMGLERITAILQGVTNNYDIDLFRHLIAASVDFSGAQSEGEAVFSHRVIADHLRSTSFLIADGVLPSNEGRGYVLRRIMRRAMRHAHLIGSKDPVDAPAGADAGRGNGLGLSRTQARRRALIAETLKLEGNPLPRNAGARPQAARRSERRRSARATTLAGDVAFKLYDTYGFPLDLTQDALKGQGHRRRHRRLRRGDGQAARRGAQGLGRLGRGRDRCAMVRGARRIRLDRIPRLRHREKPKATSSPCSRTASACRTPRPARPS